MSEYLYDDEPICGACNGSGEGMFDGSTCYTCKGSGVDPRPRKDDRDYLGEEMDREWESRHDKEE